MSDSDIIGAPLVEYEAIDPIFCWRYYAFGRCARHDCLALRGQLHTFVHSSLVPEAICRKLDPNNSMPYCAEAAPRGTQPHDAPDFGCICGYYALFEPRPYAFRGEIAVWGQAIGPTVLNETGLKTRQFRMLAGFLPTTKLRLGGWSKLPEDEVIVEHFASLAVPLARPEQAGMLLDALGIPVNVEQLYGLS